MAEHALNFKLGNSSLYMALALRDFRDKDHCAAAL